MIQVSKVFQLNRQGFNLRGGVVFAVVLGLLIIVGVLPAERRYFLTAIFGALIVAVSDPGGNYGYRVPRLAVVAAAGALLTALGFGIGGGAWGFVVLAAFVATLLGGLAVTYGLHRFVAAYLLNVWFIIALGLPTLISFQVPGLFQSGLSTPNRGSRPAWLTGSALWIANFIMWLAPAGHRTAACRRDPRGYLAAAADPANYPFRGDPGRRPGDRRRDLLRAAPAQRLLDAHRHHHCHEARPAAIRPHRRAAHRRDGRGRRGGRARPAGGRQQDRTRSHRRRPGRAGGVDPRRELRLVHRGLGRSHPDRRGVPHPSNLADEGRRILFTFAGVGIAVIVMFLADRLQKHAAKAAPQAPAHPARAT